MLRGNALVFLEKNFIFMVFLAVQVTGNANEFCIVSCYKTVLNDVSSGKLNSQKYHKDAVFFTKKFNALRLK